MTVKPLYIAVPLLAAAVLLMLRRVIRAKGKRDRLSGLADSPAHDNGVGKRGKDRYVQPDAGDGGFFGKLVSTVDNTLYGAGIFMNPVRFTAVWIACAICLPAIMNLLGVNTAVCVTASAVIAAVPLILIRIKRRKRTERFEEQLVDAIDILNSAMKAGYSFQSALQTVYRSSGDPISEEFEIVFNETQLGVPLEESLRNLAGRVRSPDVDIFCTAIIVQSSVGGNLIEVLSNIGKTVRDRLRIRKEIRSKTASGRMSGYIVGALPFLLTLALMIISPDYLSGFLQIPAGRIAIAVGFCFMVTGFLIIRKIVDVKY